MENNFIEEILKIESLDIYEKMCIITLETFNEEDFEISSMELSQLMGCSREKASCAFSKLVAKGFIKRIDKVISSDEKVKVDLFKLNSFEEVEDKASENIKFFEMMKEEGHKKENQKEEENKGFLNKELLNKDPLIEKEKKIFVSDKFKKEKSNKLDRVVEIIGENLNHKEANIILSFAGGDLEKIRKAYAIARKSQLNDTVGVLINELQKKDPIVDVDNLSKQEDGKGEKIRREDIQQRTDENIKDMLKSHERSQVDTAKIMKLQRYQQYNKSK